ncbi:hypothetical protein EGR_03666 [Echinococcus granulosus]|uniref:Uncharacterized protein n=1 Tax=Echinococcus granulosus TaxID=6210 RepID=W6UJR9_ECHGR|nr:hypothetical protein EGR_03666 [Echinococcus granulosus]EUB61376.1 hypothetical protein EGR_03666 [Echinococcus granulosus]
MPDGDHGLSDYLTNGSGSWSEKVTAVEDGVNDKDERETRIWRTLVCNSGSVIHICIECC